jgi:PiT family inorganic phosphate transporter
MGGFLAFVLFMYIRKAILRTEQPVQAAMRHIPIIVFIMTVVVLLATIYKGLKHVIGNIAFLAGGRSFWLSIALSMVAAVVSSFLVKRKLAGMQNAPLRLQLEAVERVFVPMVIISSCSVAFAHGANDVANSVGPLAAIVNILQTGVVDMKVPVPLWILTLGGAGIVMGLATYGYRVMMTVGTKITEITPSRGVAADIAASATVLACTRLSLPVSTTHTLVGAILGIGLARGLSGINRQIVSSIFGSWLFTVPAAAIMSMIFFVFGRVFFFQTISAIIQY